MTVLNQTIAIEKGVKARANSEISELYKAIQKADLFNGLSKVYKKKNEEDEDLPSERKLVNMTSQDAIRRLSLTLTELFDVTATKEVGNTKAAAAVVVDGVTVIDTVPVGYLLFLEKQLTDIRAFVDKMPVLDFAEKWTFDGASGFHVSDVTTTHRTKKVQKPIVLYDATDKHPAQTQIITDDQIVGFWEQTKQSGAMERLQKERLVRKVDKLLIAVKAAREEANSIEVDKVNIGETIFGYLFAE